MKNLLEYNHVCSPGKTQGPEFDPNHYREKKKTKYNKDLAIKEVRV